MTTYAFALRPLARLSPHTLSDLLATPSCGFKATAEIARREKTRGRDRVAIHLQLIACARSSAWRVGDKYTTEYVTTYAIAID